MDCHNLINCWLVDIKPLGIDTALQWNNILEQIFLEQEMIY